MQSALKLCTLLLCLTFASGGGPLPPLAAGERTLMAGCPATAIVCPVPKPASGDTPAPPKNAKKGAKG
jgi:hypothetical protein